MRIGIMGGTFDPIHLGHLRAAEEIYWAFDLDKIIFIPSSRPPHKDQNKVTPALHRYEMVSLATVFTPYFSVSSIEIDRPGRSYSIETIQELEKVYGKDAILYERTFELPFARCRSDHVDFVRVEGRRPLREREYRLRHDLGCRADYEDEAFPECACRHASIVCKSRATCKWRNVSEMFRHRVYEDRGEEASDQRGSRATEPVAR